MDTVLGQVMGAQPSLHKVHTGALSTSVPKERLGIAYSSSRGNSTQREWNVWVGAAMCALSFSQGVISIAEALLIGMCIEGIIHAKMQDSDVSVPFMDHQGNAFFHHGECTPQVLYTIQVLSPDSSLEPMPRISVWSYSWAFCCTVV